MRISLIKGNIIKNLVLPNQVFGSFWVTDFDINGIEQNLINVEAVDGKWQINSNNDVFLTNNDNYLDNIKLEQYHFYNLKDKVNDRNLLLYCSPSSEANFDYFNLSSYGKKEITIGKNRDCDIYYSFTSVDDVHARISIEEGKITLIDNNSNFGVYVNNVRVRDSIDILNGDVIFILGLKVVVLIINNTIYLLINNPSNLVDSKIVPSDAPVNTAQQFDEPVEEKEMLVYNQEDYYHKKPRFIYTVKELELNIDSPPAKSEDKEMPLLLTVGPMLTMGMTSMMSGYMAINNVMSGNATWKTAAPSLVITGAMLASVFIWPLFSKSYTKKQKKKSEAERQKKYRAYIDKKRTAIAVEMKNQQTILTNGNPSLAECQNVILNKQINLWERRREDSDFLQVSIGTGTVPMAINIKYSEEHFSMLEDDLKNIVEQLGSEPKKLVGVPIPYSFVENYITGIIGKEHLNMILIKNILLQIMAFHSYDDVKIALFTNQINEQNWSFCKTLPHTWSNDYSNHFYATNNEEYKELCYNLERIYSARKEAETNKEESATSYKPLFLIITDSFRAIRNFDFIKNIVESKKNYGFSMVILSDKITNLPDQCPIFLQLENEGGEIIRNTALNEGLEFNLDFTSYDLLKCANKLANIPLEIVDAEEGQIPNQLGFLELYDVGRVEQLNSLNRWNKNVPILNMQVPVGIGKSGEKIGLDLHEKYHGPHGLIAGMTGSGKSEFIVTYILSMAINYHPYEVQFILIDYKGGGLAGAFENASNGLKLPHLVGTITNLDANEIKRSLASIDSELKRRQRLFNKAREISGESSVDIYKYQKMYRDKQVAEPVSHLFIIADEFAELKTQQPDFMENLISAARIGRSLGVHLILATQKPSGVVDPQIWSNTRFRVCLRVQEKSDSQEVIKNPDAAMLKQTGRFYLQVGFNEIFVLGQSAWAGGQYLPSEKISKPIDSATLFVDNLGSIIKNIDNKVKKEVTEAKGEELGNILAYLCSIAKEENLHTKPLWLEKLAPQIFVEDLMNKYDYKSTEFVLNPIIGEYDVPNMQAQHLLTLPFSEVGNAVVYGATGSGKENFIMTILYSSMLTRSAKEVNYYIIDFGAEVFKNFKNSSIIGDIIYISDREKIVNLYKMIAVMIEERKKLFVDYNGDYYTYCTKSGQSVPTIVIIINNYDAYQETYPEFDEDLIVLTRDSLKYGIYFLITAVNPSALRYKLKQNFAALFALQQNSDDDFNTILGSVQKAYPSKIFGRGIIKKEGVNEFQTALITERDEIQNFIKSKVIELSNKDMMKAREIPILPEVVSYSDIATEFGKSEEWVIGIDKETLQITKFDFNHDLINVITTQDNTIFSNFLTPFINQVIALNKYNLLVFNTDEIELDDASKKYYQHFDNDFDSAFLKLTSDIKESSPNKPTICLIIGVDSLKNKLNEENKTAFDKMFTSNKNLKYIFVDSIDKIKKIESESWFRNNVNLSNGIWIGNGVNDQFTLKITTKIPSLRDSINNNFCFIIKKGRPTLVKYVEKFDIKTS